jgi:hypothetical protein
MLVEQPEHQQLIVDAGALPLLVNLLKRHKNANTRAVNSLIRRAADAITNLAHENSNIKTCIRCVQLTFDHSMLLFLGSSVLADGFDSLQN